MSLTGTRPTVGLIYVGLAKAIAGTPTAIALLDKLADENHTLRMEITRRWRKFLVSIPRFLVFPINRHKLVHIRTLDLFLTPFLHTLRIFDKPSKQEVSPLYTATYKQIPHHPFEVAKRWARKDRSGTPRHPLFELGTDPLSTRFYRAYSSDRPYC